MHSATKITVLPQSTQVTPKEQNWSQFKVQTSDVLSMEGFPACRPPAGRPVHHTKLTTGAAPTFVPRFRLAQHIEEEIDPNDREKTKSDCQLVLLDIALYTRRMTGSGMCAVTSVPPTKPRRSKSYQRLGKTSYFTACSV